MRTISRSKIMHGTHLVTGQDEVLNSCDFAKLRTDHFAFVDKSLPIRDLLKNPARVTLFIRPWRFGKTLNLSMLRWFFELPQEALGRSERLPAQQRDAQKFTRDLFIGLSPIGFLCPSDTCLSQAVSEGLFAALRAEKRVSGDAGGGEKEA